MTTPFSLNGMNVLITGGSSGIGRQCAISCSNMGADVILIARDEERLQQTLSQLSDGDHAYYVMDLLDFEKYVDMITSIVKRHGKISGFIHSAGVDSTVPLSASKPDVIDEVFRINALACFELIRLLSKKKNVGKNASFIGMASVMATRTQKGVMPYCASKAALLNGLKSLALELAPKNIRVNTVSPAIVETELVAHLFSTMSDQNIEKIKSKHPLGFGSPIDVANLCVYLLSPAARWSTGTDYIIDGGYTAQ